MVVGDAPRFFKFEGAELFYFKGGAPVCNGFISSFRG